MREECVDAVDHTIEVGIEDLVEVCTVRPVSFQANTCVKMKEVELLATLPRSPFTTLLSDTFGF